VRKTGSRLTLVSLQATSQSVEAVAQCLVRTSAELDLLQTSSAPNDQLAGALIPFIAEAAPVIARLTALQSDLNRELKALLHYYGEKVEGEDSTKPEDFFAMILGFSSALHKAAAEMSKDVVKEAGKGEPKADLSKLSVAAQKREASSGSITPTSAPTSIRAMQADDALSTLAMGLPKSVAIRGTMSRGDLDEAIRSIHGGVRRQDRMQGTMGRERASVRLSKIFLDGVQG
jgi:diaphanous 1